MLGRIVPMKQICLTNCNKSQDLEACHNARFVGHRDLPWVSKACPSFDASAEYKDLKPLALEQSVTSSLPSVALMT